MKKRVSLLVAVLGMVIVFCPSCTTVKSGHKGVEVSWGGKTNLQIVHPEGMNSGIHWVWDDVVEYDVREKTLVRLFEFNDKNNMSTTVELSLDYNLNPHKVNLLHTEITDVETKILKTLKSAGKEVVPQYSAVELNITKRAEAEEKLSKIISEELPEFYVEFARMQMTDVDIPKTVAKLAEETAVQLGRNELAKKKEAEQVALAAARVARSKGDYEAAEYDAKTKDIMSQPKMLKLKELEIKELWARQGVSPYGNNNVFGAQTTVLKGLIR
jgi:regulator of protease activity HflC (stomatin/prohibitin superfamily)